MAVKVNHRHGAVSPVDGAEQGQRNRVVSAERDNTRKRLALLGQAGLVGGGLWRPAENLIVSLLDLLEGPRVVVTVYCQCIEGQGKDAWDTDEVTGMSPQSRTVAQLLNGFVSRGTL
jgi:hypothetical protein